MKFSISISLLFLLFSQLNSQVTFQKAYSSNNDVIRSTGIYQSNIDSEIIMTISNYTKGNSSILFLNRNGNQKHVATLNLSFNYEYIANLYLDGDSIIYGCGANSNVQKEVNCNGEMKGFYFKLKINRVGSTITHNIIWLKEDNVSISNSTASYYLSINASSDKLYLSGTTYASGYTGCAGNARSQVFELDKSTGKILKNIRFNNGTSINFNYISDIFVDNKNLYTIGGDWRKDPTPVSSVYFLNIRKLKLNTLMPDTLKSGVLGIGHYSGNLNASLLGSNSVVGVVDEDSTFVAGLLAGRDPWNNDSIISIARFNKNTLNISKQITIPFGPNEYKITHKLLKSQEGFLLLYTVGPTNFSSVPTKVKLISFDQNLNIIKSFELNDNIFSNHKSGGFAYNIYFLNKNELYIATNVNERSVILHRLDIRTTDTGCVRLKTVNLNPLFKISSKQILSCLTDTFSFTQTNGSSSSNTFVDSIGCVNNNIRPYILVHRFDTLVYYQDTTFIDWYDTVVLSAFAQKTNGEYFFKWTKDNLPTALSYNPTIKVSEEGFYTVAVTGDFSKTSISSIFVKKKAKIVSSINNLDRSITAFPNPSDGIVYINCDNNGNKLTFGKLFNVHGKELVGDYISTNADLIKIDLISAPNGIYFIHLKDANDNTYICKILKQ